MIVQIVLGIVLAVFISFYLNCALANYIVSKKIYGRRGDGSISIKYAYPSDYPNLSVKKSYFLNDKKARLSCYEYSVNGTNPKGVILFSHGVGSGHFYSLNLINYLCEIGFIVVAYDQYASGTSEGRRMESMIQGAIDIKYAVKYVESHYDESLPFYVIGHSWGGYCAAQALRYSKRISKCISIAGLDSESAMSKNIVARIFAKLCGYTKYGKYSFYTCLGAFKKTNAQVMYLQGKQDMIVPPSQTGYRYEKILKDKKNIKVVLLDKKGHSPIVDFESQLKQSEVMKQFGLLGGVLVPLDVYVDFQKNNVPDMNVYKMIGDFFLN